MTGAAGLSLEALSRYRLRTALSMVGVMVGVGAVVAMLAVGQGARAEAMRQVSQLGLSNLVLRSRALAGPQQTTTPGLTIRDVDRLASLSPAAAGVAALRERGVIASGTLSQQPSIVLGISASYFNILDLAVVEGRGLSDLDDQRGMRVCVISSELAAMLFGPRAAIGEIVNLDQVPYRVIGILADREETPGALGPISPRSLKRAVLVPLSALAAHDLALDPEMKVHEIWVRVDAADDPAVVAGLVRRSLSAARPNGDDFEVIVPKELLEQRLRLRRTFDIVVGAVAMATLLVGSIGVMNVMLTAILERTQEIGLRRAVGATRRAIGAQFLLEAVIITTAGGFVGLVLGLGAAWAIGAFAGWPIVISPSNIVAAIALAIGTGLLSGVYPARRASLIAPYEALRFE